MKIVNIPKPIIKCKNCKHFESGYCKAFKFSYHDISQNKLEHYFMSTYEARMNTHLCGPDARLFSKKLPGASETCI